MKRARCPRALRLLSGVALALLPALAHAQTTAFFYGAPVPRELFHVYDQVVVQPDQAPRPEQYQGLHGQPVAYFSLGEVRADSAEAAALKPEWIIGRNAGWATWVLDPRSPALRQHQLEQLEQLWQRGYRSFFLDTLDSYQLGLARPGEQSAAAAGWSQLIAELLRRHPDARVLVNRGFELLPEIGALVKGVVVESLFDGWSASTQSYAPVPAEGRRWLLEQLQRVRERFGLPVTVIDYQPPSEREAARRTAQRIAELGFEPWVSDPLLTTLGVGSREILPRQILLLTDDPPEQESAALRLLAPVIEHLGYVPVQHRLAEGLPPELVTRYAGLITWLSSNAAPAGYPSWLQRQIQSGVRVAMFGQPGLPAEGAEARALGLRVVGWSSPEPTRVLAHDELVGFEAPVPARPFDGPLLALEAPGTRLHLALRDAAGRSGVAAATCRWGGLAVSHLLTLRGLGGERAWVLDPFAFLERALALPPVPQPDLTSENGRRIALSRIRAAGLSWPARVPGTPPAASLLAALLERHPAPHELELAATGAVTASPEDRELGQRWIAEGRVREAAPLLPGATALRRERPWLTQLEPSVRPVAAGWLPVAPIAPDLGYLPLQSDAGYPYARVLETLELTERPRRLKPVLLDYHAFLATSPGGLATLDALYRAVAERRPYWLDIEQYRARVLAFREQVVARWLDGRLSYHGGQALLTVRLPRVSGTPDLRASRGVAVYGGARQGEAEPGPYVSFVPGAERVLALVQGARAEQLASWPHLTEASGRVLSFVASASEQGQRAEFELSGSAPLRFTLAGLRAGAACRLSVAEGLREGRADAAGRWSVALERTDTGPATLLCGAPEVQP